MMDIDLSCILTLLTYHCVCGSSMHSSHHEAWCPVRGKMCSENRSCTVLFMLVPVLFDWMPLIVQMVCSWYDVRSVNLEQNMILWRMRLAAQAVEIEVVLRFCALEHRRLIVTLRSADAVANVFQWHVTQMRRT
jgi:hypothetical protein